MVAIEWEVQSIRSYSPADFVTYHSSSLDMRVFVCVCVCACAPYTFKPLLFEMMGAYFFLLCFYLIFLGFHILKIKYPLILWSFS